MSRTEQEVLEETNGDLLAAYRLVCSCYDRARGMVSAGYARADTSRLAWNPKPPPDEALGDDWLKTGTDAGRE